jgi:TolB-like protein
MNSLRWLFLSGILLVFFLLSALPASSDNSDKGMKSIGFLPFSIHAAQDLSYLRHGIPDMLASRLAAETGATVMNMNSALKAHDGPALQRILESGRHQQADFLVTGNLTSGADGLSLEVHVYETGNSAGPIRFRAETESKGEMFQVIEQLALQMAEKLYGQKRQISQAAEAAETPDQHSAPSPLQATHPERPFLTPDAEIIDLQP